MPRLRHLVTDSRRIENADECSGTSLRIMQHGIDFAAAQSLHSLGFHIPRDAGAINDSRFDLDAVPGKVPGEIAGAVLACEM